MKKIVFLMLALLLAWPAPTIARAEVLFSAYRKDATVFGQYLPPENMVVAGLVLVSKTDAKQFELFGAARLERPTPGVVCTFTVDLDAVQGLARITALKSGTSQYTSTLTQAQRDELQSGQLSLRMYRGEEYTQDDLLAECPVLSDFTEMTLSSAGVVNGVLADAFGKKGTQKHKGIPTRSMPLTVGNIPEGTRALAVSMIDPDGQNWVHWLAVNLPVQPELPENASVDLAEQIVQGKNDFGQIGYGGPTPPSGTHRYVITVYALSHLLDLKNGFKQNAFQKAIDGKILAEAILRVDYSRK